MKLLMISLIMMMNSPAEYQEYAAKHVHTYEIQCMKELWRKESNWRPQAKSPTHDYGIPQRHMKGKTKAEIDAFRKSPRLQIHWGINYVRHRYGDFCSALAFHKRNNWY